MKIQPGLGNVDSSTKLVLQINEKSSRATATSIPVLSLYYKPMKSSRVAGRAIPVLSLYYKPMKIQPGRGNVDSSTKLVLQTNENPAG